MAGSLNKVMIIGNLTRDPELRQTGGGNPVCNIGIATNRSWKDASGERQEQVEYHNIVAWGKLAEISAQYLAKGRKAYFDGRLQTREWEGQDGVKRFRTEIVAENMIMLDRGGAGAPGSGSFGGASTGNAYESMPPIGDEPSASPDNEIKIEDIPF
ncbi:MAG: single-stranded DNA-binding protein [Candidatus Uhrbacteria bacterium]|nr:single-stranded DNA-binding protein [Candidatus Uhrbacteria bacterium]